MPTNGCDPNFTKNTEKQGILAIFAETHADPEAPGARGVGSMGPGRLHAPREVADRLFVHNMRENVAQRQYETLKKKQ